MKLIKFIAAAALVASTSLMSAGSVAPAGLEPQIAGCTNWPFCREIELRNSESSVNLARGCTNWPFCREVEIIDQSLAQLQVKTEVVRKAA